MSRLALRQTKIISIKNSSYLSQRVATFNTRNPDQRSQIPKGGVKKKKTKQNKPPFRIARKTYLKTFILMFKLCDVLELRKKT